MKKISLCMVVFNEAHRIAETLTLAAPHVDEIVIVDQQSTDGTRGVVAEWFGSNSSNPYTKIINDKHWGYCEPSRKLAHKHATGDWILVLDADERISDEFAEEMWEIIARSEQCQWYGVRLKRSLWINGIHSWTGDYQYRFFRKDSVRYLDEIHTEPQPTIHKDQIYAPEYIGIVHTKSWSEQIRDETAYDILLAGISGESADRKRALNVYSQLLADAGLTAEEADAMTPAQRVAAGVILNGDVAS